MFNVCQPVEDKKKEILKKKKNIGINVFRYWKVLIVTFDFYASHWVSYQLWEELDLTEEIKRFRPGSYLSWKL